MRKITSKLMLYTLISGSCISVMGQEVDLTGKNVIPNTIATKVQVGQQNEQEIKQGETDYRLIQNKVYIPFKWLLNEIGIDGFKWGKGQGPIKGYITVDAPAYFSSRYYENLKWGLNIYSTEEEKGLVALPESLKSIANLKDTNEEGVADTSSLNKKPVDFTLTSDGYKYERVIYNYKIEGGVLYLPVDEIKDYFGIEEVSIDQEDKKAVIKYIPQNVLQAKLKEEINKMGEQLRLQKPEDVLSMWIRAQQLRNGAIQYNMLSKELQEKVLPEVKTRGWVTGGSSPTLKCGKVTIKDEEKLDAHNIRYTITLESMLQGQVYEEIQQVVTIKEYQEEGKSYYCITSVTGDVDYYTYSNVSK